MDFSSKTQARKWAKTQRSEAAKAAPNAGQDILSAWTRDGERFKAGLGVSFYLPIGSEIDPRPLMDHLKAQGHYSLLPVVTDQRLIFRKWQDGDDLVAAGFGLHEPSDEAPEDEPDIILTPLLGFTDQGDRLGYGQGHFDRTLQDLRAKKDVLVIGVAYHSQQMADFPTDQYDQPLDAVLTDKELIITRQENFDAFCLSRRHHGQGRAQSRGQTCAHHTPKT